MGSINHVLPWLCLRRCDYFHEIRFHPYVYDEKSALVNEVLTSHACIIANLLYWITYLNLCIGFDLFRRQVFGPLIGGLSCGRKVQKMAK